MPTRISTWAILIWTVLVAVGTILAIRNIGGDCVGVSDLAACQEAAWIRGGIGIALLMLLWFVGFVPLAIAWFITRPKENVIVFGPAGRQFIVSEKEAEKRVTQEGWSYQAPA